MYLSLITETPCRDTHTDNRDTLYTYLFLSTLIVHQTAVIQVSSWALPASCPRGAPCGMAADPEPPWSQHAWDYAQHPLWSWKASWVTPAGHWQCSYTGCRLRTSQEFHQEPLLKIIAFELKTRNSHRNLQIHRFANAVPLWIPTAVRSLGRFTVQWQLNKKMHSVEVLTGTVPTDTNSCR